MNCTEFQNRLMQEPACTEAEFLQHVSDCDICCEQYEQALKFEAVLLDAMEVDIPDDLAERVLLGIQDNKQHAATFGMYRLALVASFMVLFVLAGWMGFQWGGQAAYAEKLPLVVSQHIEKELRHLHVQGRMRDASVAQLFSRFGAVMHTSVGKATFAEPCWIRYRYGVHLILRETSGPVTLMFMPGEYVTQAQSFLWEQYSGLIVPTDYGSVAIVAATPEVADQVRLRISDAIMWSGA